MIQSQLSCINGGLGEMVITRVCGTRSTGSIPVGHPNMRPQKILFISCSAGMGHVRAADALFFYAKKNYPNWETFHIDLAEYSSPLIKIPTTTGYRAVVKHWPGLWKFLYRSLDSKQRMNFLSKLNFLIEFNSKKLLKFIKTYQPDRIICTHFLAGYALKEVAQKIPVDMVITDYYAHKIWQSPFIRYYFIANEEIKNDLNLSAEQAIVSGLPIDPKFLENKNNRELKNKFSILPNRPTILLLAGGDGLIDTSVIAKRIMEEMSDINLLAVAGKKNLKIYNKLKKITSLKNNYKFFSFTPDIDELMRTSDIIITKPGGLTLSECLYLQKPIIMINPIPGQEEKNVDFIEKNNYGVVLKKETDVKNLINDILNKRKILAIKNKDKIPPNEIILAK